MVDQKTFVVHQIRRHRPLALHFGGNKPTAWTLGARRGSGVGSPQDAEIIKRGEEAGELGFKAPWRVAVDKRRGPPPPRR